MCVLPVINHLLPDKRKIISNSQERRNFTSLIKILLSYYQITMIVTKIDMDLPFNLSGYFNVTLRYTLEYGSWKIYLFT